MAEGIGTNATRGNGSGAALSDVGTLRARARRDIDDGPVTPGYQANREEVLRLLNESLATELVCVLRYKRHYYMAKGPQAEAAAEFLEHADDIASLMAGDLSLERQAAK